MTESREPSSFRDPDGYLYTRDGLLYRQINTSYQTNYDHLINSGLYEELIKNDLLIPHEVVDISYRYSNSAYKVIKPERLEFVSYPYEWCFSQLKDAALTSFRIQKIALEFGMSLKDCSAYNIQFHRGRPVFIDTLSFEIYQEGSPWVAYRQACQHFLAPLSLISSKDVRLAQLFRIFVDGIPLDLASRLLPWKTRLRFSLLTHIHLHAKSQARFANKPIKNRPMKISRAALLGLVDSLESSVKALQWSVPQTEWAGYYSETNYSQEAQQSKTKIVDEYLSYAEPDVVWDLGANTGFYSRIASQRGYKFVAAFDIDPVAVEKNYLMSRSNNEVNLLPLSLDLVNPSPGIGWCNEERMSLLKRGPVDTAMALALIHHLAISNNLPFSQIAEFFSSICRHLIIEFVPKDDSQVQRLLQTREDIFAQYDQSTFEREFQSYFEILKMTKITDSTRTLYLLRNRIET